MEEITNGYFFSPTKGNMTLDHVVDEIISYVKEDTEKFYDVVVGCDSSSGEEPNFPLAVVVLRKGEGGRFFLKRIKYSSERKFYNWKQRILNEVYLSCQLALLLREKFGEKAGKEISNYELKYIHADVGENGVTKDMIKEVTGLIRGNGFEPKIKPESFVASIVADRYA
ncbi:MAG: ribonuclease H-like YkuK family protein [Candidatus Nealsonbacteria bacterium]